MSRTTINAAIAARIANKTQPQSISPADVAGTLTDLLGETVLQEDLESALDQRLSSLNTNINTIRLNLQSQIDALSAQITNINQNFDQLETLIGNRFQTLQAQIAAAVTATQYLDLYVGEDANNNEVILCRDENVDLDTLPAGVWNATCEVGENVKLAGQFVCTQYHNNEYAVIKTQFGYTIADGKLKFSKRIYVNGTWSAWSSGEFTYSIESTNTNRAIGYGIGINASPGIQAALATALADSDYADNSDFIAGVVAGMTAAGYTNNNNGGGDNGDDNGEDNGESGGENSSGPTEAQLTEAYNAGYDEGYNIENIGINENPYNESEEPELYAEYERGYLAGWAENENNSDSPNYAGPDPEALEDPQAVESARRDGSDAGASDSYEGETSNPYDNETDPDIYTAWEDGYATGWGSNPNNPNNQTPE